MLAWTRTSLALIGFGFTIDKFFESLPKRAPSTFPFNPQSFGVIMIGFGLLTLGLAVYELRQFRKSHPDVPPSTAGFVAAMIGVLGVIALIAAFIH